MLRPIWNQAAVPSSTNHWSGGLVKQGIPDIPHPSDTFKVLLGQSRGISRPGEINNSSSQLLVYRGFLQLDMSRRPPGGRWLGGILSDAWTTSAGSFWCEGAASLRISKLPLNVLKAELATLRRKLTSATCIFFSSAFLGTFFFK